MPDTKPKNAERFLDGPADPTLRAARHHAHRPDEGAAFLPDPSAHPDRHAPLTADAAEAFGEEFIACATGGEDVALEANDEIAEDEDGGPFLVLEADDDDVHLGPFDDGFPAVDPSLDAETTPDAAPPDVQRDEPTSRPTRRRRPSA
jgi:hypothetical protein